MFSAESSGTNFKNMENFLKRAQRSDVFAALGKWGQVGVNALAAATPKDSGETAAGWIYEIKQSRGSYEIVWRNTHVVDGQVIALLLQYGHGTGTGGYVPGRDYINPQMKPIFEKILAECRKVVSG